MKKVSELFDSRSKKYNDIYTDAHSKKLLHQEKKVRAETVKELVINYLPPINNGIVVDVGCGMGNVLLNLRESGLKAEMYGVDISKEMIRLANSSLNEVGYENINFSIGSIEDIKVSANLVLSLGVAGYHHKQAEFLAGLSSLVDTNGYLIFSTANGDSFLRLTRRYLSKIHSYITGKKKVEFSSIKDKHVESLLTNNGFKAQKKIYITFGLGLFASSIECSIDRWFFKNFRNSFISKYLSLTVLYVYKRVD